MICSTCAAFAVLVFSLATAHAALFDVNVTDDGKDLNPGDGICDSNQLAGFQCTLRAGVEETNALAGDDILRLGVGAIHELLITEILVVNDPTGSLTVRGMSSILPAQITIDYSELQQIIFSVNTHLELENILLRDADNEFDKAIDGGGTVNIINSVLLNNYIGIDGVSGTVSNTRFLNNAIAARAFGVTLDVTDSTFTDNDLAATTAFGGTLNLTRVLVQGTGTKDRRGDGSVENNGGTVRIVDSRIINNEHRGVGVNCAEGAGTVTFITGSLIANNNSRLLNGAGIRVIGQASIPPCVSNVFVTNTTISNNETWVTGAGIHIDGNGGSIVTLRNTTVASNHANSDMIGAGLYGGLTAFNGGFLIMNSIVANNDHFQGGDFVPSDCWGVVDSEGYNLFFEPHADCLIQAVTTGNIIGVDPELGLLSDNGGPTLTHPLSAGSPAIDSGNPGGCKADLDSMLPIVDENLTVDQRDFPRPVDGDNNGSVICDMGAYEAATADQPEMIFEDGFETGG